MYRPTAHIVAERHLFDSWRDLDCANAATDDLDGNRIVPRTTYNLIFREVARVTGLEPATSGVTGRRSNQLSYTR